MLPFASNYSKIPDAPVVIIDHMSVQPFSFAQTSASRRQRSNFNTLACMGTPQIDGAQDQVRSFRITSCLFHELRTHAIPQKASARIHVAFSTLSDVRPVATGHASSLAFPARFLQAFDVDTRDSCTHYLEPSIYFAFPPESCILLQFCTALQFCPPLSLLGECRTRGNTCFAWRLARLVARQVRIRPTK